MPGFKLPSVFGRPAPGGPAHHVPQDGGPASTRGRCAAAVLAAASVLACSTTLFAAATITVDDNPVHDPDPNDAFAGAVVTSAAGRAWIHSPLDPKEEEHVSDIFGGYTDWHLEPGATRFDNTPYYKVHTDDQLTPGPANGINLDPPYIQFHTAQPVTIGGVRLTTGNGGDYHHEIIRFRLFASSDGGATYTVPLSDVVVLDGPYNLAWDHPSYLDQYNATNLIITDIFDQPVTYQYFRAEFHVKNGDPNSITIRELDALPVPEPSALAGLGLAALGLVHRRRR